MKKIEWTEAEIKSIKEHGECCFAVAKSAMERSGFNFDDIEELNNHYEEHAWGSNADRQYRKSAVNKAINKVAKYAIDYI